MVRLQNTVKNGPEQSTSSQDSGSSSVSCQSKRSKDDIITFKAPSSPSLSAHHHGSRQAADNVCVTEENQQALPRDTAESANKRRNKDSATASASRQTDSSNGDNIHGQEEPSSVSSDRSRIRRGSGSSIESCQSDGSKDAIIDFKEEPSSPRSTSSQDSGTSNVSCQSKRSKDHIITFKELSSPRSTSSQDSDTSNVSCQSKRSKDAIITFKAPSSPRRNKDSATASASRQSDSSNGDNIHGQEEPSSVRSTIKRHSGSSIESCQSKRSKGDALLSVPLQQFLSFGLGYPLLLESRTMSSWPHGHLTDFMTPSPPERKSAGIPLDF